MVLELVLLWFIALAQLALAYRAVSIERRAGLEPSTQRLKVVAALAAVATALVVVCAVPSLSQGVSNILSPPQYQEEIAAIQDELTKLNQDVRAQKVKVEKEPEFAEVQETASELAKRKVALASTQTAMDLRQLVDKREERHEELALLRQQSDAAALQQVDVGRIAALILLLLVLGGVAALVLLGDTTHLLPRRLQGERAVKAQGGLDALAAAADAGEYEAGLKAADVLEEKLLAAIDRLDWLFLRSYCALQVATHPDLSPPPGVARRQTLLEQAARDLSTLLEQAPKRVEAAYALGLARSALQEHEEAVEALDAARELGSSDLPLDHVLSVCLLQLGEERLSRGDTDSARESFARVKSLGVLHKQIPVAHLKMSLLGVRSALQGGELEEAEKALREVREMVDPKEQQSALEVCDAFQTLIEVRRGADEAAIDQVQDFLARGLPGGKLPDVDEEIAEEHLESPLDLKALPLPPDVYAGFLFAEASARARLLAERPGRPRTKDIDALTKPLLQALLFRLRDRELLAALGGIYYWFKPKFRRRAVEWLEAAQALGVRSRIVRRLLERDRRQELEQREALDWFRSESDRFLRDPTLRKEVRAALFEELGRFQEFQPVLLELEDTRDLESSEPTLALLGERARYLENVAQDISRRAGGEEVKDLERLRGEYLTLVASLEATTNKLSEIEGEVMSRLGKIVLARRES